MIASKCDQVSQGCDFNLRQLKECIDKDHLQLGLEKRELHRMSQICVAAVAVSYDQLEQGVDALEGLVDTTEALLAGSIGPATIAFGNKLLKILSQKTSSLREYTTVVQSQPISEPSTSGGTSLFSFFSKFSKSSNTRTPPAKRLTLPDGTFSDPCAPRVPRVHPSCPFLTPIGTSSPRRAHSNIRDFEIVSPLSSGGFGRVYLAKKNKTGDLYAIKVIKKAHLSQKNISALTERNAMALAHKAFVCNLYYAFQSRDLLFLVMEYIAGGDLSSLLGKLGQFSEHTSRHYIAEIVLILEYIHRYTSLPVYVSSTPMC